jgi:competence protein ComEA
MSDWRRFADLLAVLLLNLTALGGIVWALRDPRPSAVRIELPPTASPAPAPTPVRLHVYVSGAVATADVVELAEGARARDAVLAAGGFTAAADPAAINLAAPLADGQQLHVPARGEQAGPPAGLSGPGGPVAAGSGATGGGAARPEAAPAGPINVNTASAAELEALPGVGPALAGRIVAYRQANGPFGAVEDLLEVSGIGERTLERFKGQVAVR